MSRQRTAVFYTEEKRKQWTLVHNEVQSEILGIDISVFSVKRPYVEKEDEAQDVERGGVL